MTARGEMNKMEQAVFGALIVVFLILLWMRVSMWRERKDRNREK